MPSWILLALIAGVVGTVLALGLGARVDDATYLFRRPSLLLRALLAMNVVVPLCAVVMVAAFHLRPVVELSLVALAVSPVPPLLPGRAMRAGGTARYTIGLLVAAAVLAVVFVPLAVYLLGGLVGPAMQVAPAKIALVVAVTVLAPLGVGVAVRRLAPTLAVRLEKPLSMAATGFLVAGILPALFVTLPAMRSLLGNGTLAAMVAMALAGLTAGHLLGGPDPDDRTVLALTTSSRHPGVAIAIATATVPADEGLVVAAALLYLLVNVLVSMPYQAWAQRRHARLAHGAQ